MVPFKTIVAFRQVTAWTTEDYLLIICFSIFRGASAVHSIFIDSDDEMDHSASMNRSSISRKQPKTAAKQKGISFVDDDSEEEQPVKRRRK